MKAEAPGLILFRGGNYSEQEAVERLGRVLEIIPAEELPNSVIVIEKGRIRRRYPSALTGCKKVILSKPVKNAQIPRSPASAHALPGRRNPGALA
jgi:hypothetical protein